MATQVATPVYKTSLQRLLGEMPKEQPASTMGPKCYFLDLPGEVRNEIYSYLIPSKTTLYAVRREQYSKESCFLTTDISKGPERSEPVDFTQKLFLVNKQISCEAQSLFYTSNVFAFRFGQRGTVFGLDTPHALGIFDYLNTHDLLRNIRSVHFIGSLDREPYYLSTEISDIVKSLVKFKQDGHGYVLEEVTVEFRVVEIQLIEKSGSEKRQAQINSHRNRALFGLDSLVPLTGIKVVEMLGLPDWYAKCLKLSMRSDTVTVQDAPWKTNHHQFDEAMIKAMRFPKYNWKHFAEDHGITIKPNYEWMKLIESRPAKSDQE